MLVEAQSFITLSLKKVKVSVHSPKCRRRCTEAWGIRYNMKLLGEFCLAHIKEHNKHHGTNVLCTYNAKQHPRRLHGNGEGNGTLHLENKAGKFCFWSVQREDRFPGTTSARNTVERTERFSILFSKKFGTNEVQIVNKKLNSNSPDITSACLHMTP